MKSIQLLLFLILSGNLLATPTDDQKLIALQDSLQKVGPYVFRGHDQEKMAANAKFLKWMREAVNTPGAFDFPFDSLKFMARLTSPDKVFRIMNWNLPKDDGTHLHFCFMLVNEALLSGKKHSKIRNRITVYELIDKSDEIRNPELSTLSTDKWYGCLYYKIIHTKSKKKDYYTLLGWDGNNALTWKKLIEVVTFGKDGKPIFGEKNLFERDKRSCKRVIFEFRAELVMTLHWEGSDNRIVYDHLAPEAEGAVGMYQYYSQSFTYDCFFWKKGKWLEIDNVEVVNPKSGNDDNYHKPQGDQNPH